jgi:uncharacterized protein (DUF305 family)
MRRQLWRRLIVAGTGLLTAGLLAACGGGEGGGPDAGSQPSASRPVDAAFNAADVAFATNMIPHHQQAIEMAKLAATRASNNEVKDLAGGIEKAQSLEMETMSEWLREWGTPVPPTTGSDNGGQGGMPGMMSGEEMKNLTAATGPDFDRMFLQMMIRHHQAAVEMAMTEQAQGQNPEAKTLAEQIAADQKAEINEMQSLLGKL